MIKRTFQRVHGIVRPHAPQFLRYLLSGGGAAGLEVLTVHLLSLAGVEPVISGPVSGIVGITCAFLFHKYFAFRARQGTAKQTMRYGILTAGNFIVQTGLFLLLTEQFGIYPTISKIIVIGLGVSWNFFIYKYYVYA
jgi:putative flippase GtrA